MGTFFSLCISKDMTQEQWNPVYEEALFLANKLNLMEWGKVKRFGLDLYCGLTITETEIRRNGDLGWCANGDSISLRRGEPQCVSKILTSYETTENTENPDPFMWLLNGYGVLENYDKELYKSFYHCFGNKTQYEPYHISLVSIALLIEDRLNGAAVCSDEISYSVCVKAVDEANKYLKKPIQLPVRCRKEDLYDRVKKLPIPKDRILDIFDFLYLGERDKSFFKFVEQKIPDSEKQDLLNHFISDIWFCDKPFYRKGDEIKILFNYGVSIPKLCEAFVRIGQNDEKNKDDKENEKYKSFIERILRTKIYVEKKWLDEVPSEDEENANIIQKEKKYIQQKASFFILLQE